MSFSWSFVLEYSDEQKKIWWVFTYIRAFVMSVCSDVNNLTGAAKHSGSHDTAMSSASWHFGDLAQGSDFSFPMKTESGIASQEHGGN
jgi:hypothetical protein